MGRTSKNVRLPVQKVPGSCLGLHSFRKDCNKPSLRKSMRRNGINWKMSDLRMMCMCVKERELELWKGDGVNLIFQK